MIKKVFKEKNLELIFYMNKHYIIKKIELYKNNKLLEKIIDFFIVSNENRSKFNNILKHFSSSTQNKIKDFLKEVY